VIAGTGIQSVPTLTFGLASDASMFQAALYREIPLRKLLGVDTKRTEKLWHFNTVAMLPLPPRDRRRRDHRQARPR
jgi:hypothetical protein